MTFSFKYPYLLLLLIPLAIYLFLLLKYKNYNKKKRSLPFSNIQFFKQIPPSFKVFLQRKLIYFRVFVLIFAIFAMAGPRSASEKNKIKTQGIDIMICLDVSDTMKAEDIRPNRLEVAKEMAIKFIEKRFNDRIGLLIFGSQAFVQCPLTIDHKTLIDLLSKITQDSDIGNGTAIGTAVSYGVKILKETKSKSKVIVLITDGANNSGKIDPSLSSDLAKALNIKIYTIGIGKPGYSEVPYTRNDPFWGRIKDTARVKMDELLLKEIAKKTEGHYFNAINKNELTKAYDKIDQYEKNEIDSYTYSNYKEWYVLLLLGLLGLLLLEIILSKTILQKIP